ncbi:MAG: aconitase X catalytic domain-containing protein [Candidatus Diapherotrites archaeon]
MQLTKEEQEMLAGKHGNAAKKSMEILVALGEIFGAERMVPVASVQVAGVSYDNLGDAGLEFLDEMAKDGMVRVLTTLNPAGMDLENWEALGIPPEFAKKQKLVIDAFRKMGIVTTCTCTPYLIGNLPRFGEHIAWSESSAVCFANSVLGARTNREGGPSAIAAAIAGRTPEFGLHLDENRQAQVKVTVETELNGETDFGALGHVIGNKIKNKIPLIIGVKNASIEELKSLSASIATYGGTAMFHMERVTPDKTKTPGESFAVSRKDIDEAKAKMNTASPSEAADIISIGCPHASIKEIAKLAELLEGKKVKAGKEFWVCTARPTKKIADTMGYTEKIERAGAKFACDTCMVVAPIKGRFKCIATNSAKSAYYCSGKHGFKVKMRDLDACVKEATE